MHVSPRFLPALLAALPLAFAAPASAEKITMGSDLKADATIIEANGADTAFWPISVAGQGFVIPEDGQVLSVKVKGTVLKEKGAKDPANLIHLQSLEPAAADGSRKVYLTSADFYMPIDKPNTVSAFEPENLCVKKGGSVAFNNIGGFKYGGSLGAPLDHGHYHNGAPFQVFGEVRNSVTARYTADDGTKNGSTLFTSTPNQQPGAPVGTTRAGQELLMQIVVATGDDRSLSCGGPRRHADGEIVDESSYMRIASSGGKAQRPYVTKDRRFQTGVYCGGKETCSGTATLIYKKKAVVATPFTIPALKTGRIPMRLTPAVFRALDNSRARTLPVTYVLTTSFGTFTAQLLLKR